MSFIIVYSALHTGTWSACGLLRAGHDVDTIPRSDGWFKEISTKTIENFSDQPLDKVWEKTFEQTIPEHYFPSSGDFILQAHHRNSEASMYKSLLENKPTTKIIVPTRDPLLSINSRIWRECGSLQAFRNETEAQREVRAKDQFDNFFDLLKIPKDYVFYLPIDTDSMQELNYRFEYGQNMLEFCELKSNSTFEEALAKWNCINNTNGGKYPQKQWHQFGVEDELFNGLKEAIIKKDTSKVESLLDFELSYLKENYSEFTKDMEALGYQNLLWF